MSAEREAERRYAMEHGAGYSYPREAVVTMKRGAFEAGAEWQAERDAVRIAQLEAEVEEWRRVAVEQTRLERDRAEAAEAKLDAVRALHQRGECLDMQGEPYDPPEYYCEHCYPNVWNWPCATIQAIEGDQT